MIARLETDVRMSLVIEFNYSLALTWCFPGLVRVAAAAPRTVVPRSFTFVSVRTDIIRIPSGSNYYSCKLTKSNFVAFLPHLGDQCLAGINDASKSATEKALSHVF